ncbi:MAG: porin, partial [Burkholderiales bacterium]
VYHLGGSFSEGDLTAFSPAAQRTSSRGFTFFAPTAFTTVTGSDINRTRANAELALAYGPVKFQAEYANVNFDGRAASGTAFDKDIEAYYASLLWLVTGEKYAAAYKDGVFGRIVPQSNFNPFQAGSWGAWELGVRYEDFDASDFTLFSSAVPAGLVGTGVISNSATAATTNEADAWTLGLKWIPNPNVRFLLNYVKTNFETPVRVNNNGKTEIFDDEDAVTFRAQIDF